MDELVTLQKRGTIALPSATRRRYHMEPGTTQLRVVEREDGVIELHPMVAVPANEAWFWSKRWQAMEREAAADFEAGRSASFNDVESFLADLDDE